MSLATAAFAQVATSRLEGVVQDESGAVIPGATVTVVNNKTQVRADAKADDQGRFVFPSLQPSEYTLTVEAAGFRKAVRSGIVLNVGGTVAEIVKMEVGSVTESVVVEAKSERVQTTDAVIGSATTMREIAVLPQLGRGPMALVIFQPGVQIDPSDGSFSRVNGLRQGSNNTTLDGIDANDSVVPRLGLSLTATNTDSVEEFRMLTGQGKAEYGRSAGGQVIMITKSGSNDFHGNTFDYLRNTVLNSNTFFGNKSGLTKPVLIQNIFGGSLGGPIFKDRTFFFGNYQGRRTTQQTTRNRTVLTPEAKAGIFRWKDSSGAIRSVNILDMDPRKRGIDAAVAKNLALLPDPNNFDIGDQLNTAGFRFNNPSGSMEDQFTIKGDQNMGAHHAFLRWSWQRNSSIDALNNADATYPGRLHGRQGGHRWGYSIGWDWTISPTMVNDVRVGYQSASVDFLRPARIQGPMIVSNLFTDPLSTAFPQGRNSPVRVITDNLSIVRGAHTFKGGASLRFTTQLGYNDAGIYPNINLARASGNTPPSSVVPPGLSTTDRTTYENLYNDLLGRISEVNVTYYSDLQKYFPAGTTRDRTNIFREYGYFFQDDWRVSRRLTLNVGLRYEFFGVPFEKNGFQGVLDKASQVNGYAPILDLKIQRSSKWYANDYNNFAPRFGFAYDVFGNGRTAVRGGYGIFYDRIIGATTNLVDGNTPGFSFVARARPNSAAGSDVRVSDGIPPTPAPAAPTLQLDLSRSTSVVVFNPDLATGYVQQFNLGIQQELFRNTVLEVGYVGNRGVKLFMDRNLNQPRIYEDFLGAFQQLQAFVTSGAAVPASNTLVRIFGSASAAVSAIGASNLNNGAVGGAANSVDTTYGASRYAAAGVPDFYLRLYPQFNQMIFGTNDGRSYYNSLQIQLRRDVGALKFRGNYTWSKSMDNISVDGNGFTSPIDNYNLRLNRGLSDSDRTHSFNSNLIYTLPIGRDKWLGREMPRWANTLVGGWEIGLLAIWQSGGTVTYSSGRTTGPSPNNNTWVNYSGDKHIGSVQRVGDGVLWLTQAQKDAMSFPVAGQIGTSGRNAFRGPRFFNTDISLVKKFSITERHAVNFRAESYNMFNNPNFGGLGTSLATPATLGRLSSTIGNQRLFQMALRYDF